MSDVFAEARVRIVPDTTGFKSKLDTELRTATQSATRSTAGLKSSTVGATAAQRDLEKAAGKSKLALLGLGSASSRVDSALLGLRTAIGSTAVIGLGAGALAAIALGKAFRASIQDAAAFEQELSTFQATTGATADQMQAVSTAAQQLGADITLPAVSATDATIAMTELAKAGLSVQDSIAGSRGVLQLATAAQIDNAAAAQLAANALNSFGLAGEKAITVADDLANAANASQGSISDMGLALSQSSAVARQVGLSLADTVSILSLFAKNGLQGSDAGTSLRVALIRLVAPTQKASAEIKKLGLDLRDAQGNLRPDIFAQFGEATRNLAPAARDAAAALIFGQDAIRAVSIGAREGAQGLLIMQAQIDQQGTAAELAAARTKGLAGQFSALQSNMQTLGVQFGSFVSLGLEPLLAAINSGLSNLTKFGNALERLGSIKIPTIHIPISIDIPGAPGVPGGNIGKTIATSIGREVAGATPGIGPAIQVGNFVKDFAGLARGADKSAERVRALTFEMQQLQKARISALQAPGGSGNALAEQIKRQIDSIREELKRLNDQGGSIEADVTAPLKDAITQLKAAREAAAATGQTTLVGQLTREIHAFQAQIPITEQLSGNFNRLSDDTLELRHRFDEAAGGAKKLVSAMQLLVNQSVTLDDQLQKAQAAGATPQTQIGLLQASNVAQQKIIADAERNGRQGGDITTIRKARAKIISNNSEIKSLQDGIVSDRKQAAAEAKAAATKAQKARDDQFQALADLFGGRQQNIEDAIARAGIAGNADKEARLNVALIKSLVKERGVLLARLKAIKVSASVRKTILQAINRAIESAQEEGQRLAREQTKNRKQRQQDIIDATQTHLEAVLAIAQANENKGAESRAEKALAAFDRAQIRRILGIKRRRKLTLEEAAQLDAYRVDLAQRNAALGKVKEATDAFAKQTFAFLQAQSGFAANLLGNLIPGGATGGLVGGTTGSGGTGGGFHSTGGGGGGVIDLFPGVSGPAGLAGSPRTSTSPGDSVRTTAGTAAGGPTRGGQATQNQLLRHIVKLLNDIYRGTGHPEAKHRQARNLRDMDLSNNI